MQYQFYIYKPKTICADRSFRAAVHSPELRDRLDADDFKDFEAETIKSEIEERTGDKCCVRVCFPIMNCETVRCLYITTTYDDVQNVILSLFTIAEANNLALYDAERDKTFYEALIDRSFLYDKERIQAFKDAIMREVAPVWSIHRLYTLSSENYASEYAYVVTLKKTEGISFLERTVAFYDCLCRNLADGEELRCEDRCFIIWLRSGYMSFCLEGYKKDPNMIGYMEEGQPKTELLHRMGCEKAFQFLKQYHNCSRYDVEARMCLREMLRDFPNPADRYVASVRIMKWLNRQPFNVDYSGIWFTTSYFLFHAVPHRSMPEEENELSALKIEEADVSFILPVVQEFYPYIYDRYYSSNHIPEQTLRKIVDRLKEIQFLIKTDPYNKELKPFFKEFYLSKFAKSDEDYQMIRENPAGFLAEHRYKVAILYQIVIEWAEKQLDTYMGYDRMYNIEGP